MNFRENTLLKPIGASVAPNWAASYTVTTYPVGAVASANSSGVTATVDAGHSFRVNDKALIDPGGDNTFTVAVTAVTATTITFGISSFSITTSDRLANLGPDTGTAAPNYDASPMKVYSDADGSTAIANARVT